jgi:hypothetical protein
MDVIFIPVFIFIAWLSLIQAGQWDIDARGKGCFHRKTEIDFVVYILRVSGRSDESIEDAWD